MWFKLLFTLLSEAPEAVNDVKAVMDALSSHVESKDKVAQIASVAATLATHTAAAVEQAPSS